MKLSLEEFLSQKNQFQLGDLTTEKFHPDTVGLRELATNDPSTALKKLKSVDLKAFEKYGKIKNKLKPLIKDLSNHEGRIFLVGCGATGRLVLHLEKYARMQSIDNIFSLMAGGDAALIKSIELVEDFESLGKKHLMEFNPSPSDLVIGVTEGGETSYVIGAVMAARDICKRAPYILYCNDDQDLIATCERSKKFIEDENIKNISINIGPMALAGSTRMQASTILHMALGKCLFNEDEKGLISALERFDESSLTKMMNREKNLFLENKSCIYKTCTKFGLSVLTDTTERSPTFGLDPFENLNDKNFVESFNHLEIAGVFDNKTAWSSLLSRDPRELLWNELQGRSSFNTINGFKIFDGHTKNRKKEYEYFEIRYSENHFEFSLMDENLTICCAGLNYFSQSIFLKIILNIYSTCLMATVDRFESNIMTWVRSSNYKLIDRSVRYARMLLIQKGINPSYDEVAKLVMELEVTQDESVVEKVVSFFKG